MYKHILVPTDGSKLSNAAAEAAVRLARALGARVTGFFAAPPATPIVFKGIVPVGYQAPEEHAKGIRKAAGQYLGFIRKTASAAGVACEVVSLTSDYPADAIVTAARKRRCDLIFIASHGRKGLSALLHGSETHEVLTHSSIPTLVYR